MSEAKEVKVSFTAKVMAAARAIETQRPDPLFSGFFAEQLAGADVMQFVILGWKRTKNNFFQF